MRILLGSTSNQKANIIKRFFNEFLNLEVIQCDVESGITNQPLDTSTTGQRAMNRAQNALKSYSSNDESFSIGLEGGLNMKDGIYSLVCIAAIADRSGKVVTGMSKLVPLPKLVSDRIRDSEQFGIVIREFENSLDKDSDSNIKDQVTELISRDKSFSDAIREVHKKYPAL